MPGRLVSTNESAGITYVICFIVTEIARPCSEIWLADGHLSIADLGNRVLFDRAVNRHEPAEHRNMTAVGKAVRTGQG
jgi:hypothetical protein